MTRKFMSILILVIFNVIIVKSVNPITTITMGQTRNYPTNAINWQKVLSELSVESIASNGLAVVLNKFRSKMRYGIPAFGIPVLEPFPIKKGVFETENPEIGKLKLEVKDANVYHLSTFVIDKASLSMTGPAIAVNLSIPTISAKGFYNLSGYLDNRIPLPAGVGQKIPIHGSGRFKILVNEFKIYVHAIVNYSKNIYLKSFDFDFSLDSVNPFLENLLGEKLSPLINMVAKGIIPEAVKTLKPEIILKLENYLAGAFNETLYHHSVIELINIVADLLGVP